MADLPKKARCDLVRRNVVRKEREFFKGFLILKKILTVEIWNKLFISHHGAAIT